MSAYVVSDKAINQIVAYCENSNSYRTDWIAEELNSMYSSGEALANGLFNMNCEAVDQRYGKGEWKEFHPENFKYQTEIPLPERQTYQLVKKLIYQCSEGNVVKTELYKSLVEFYNNLAHDLVQELL